MKSIFVTAAALALNLAAQPAAATPANDPPVTEAVSYADLDLNSATDQQRLKNRISFAVYRLCLVELAASPSPAIADPVCFRAAMKGALAQMERAVARAGSGPIMSASASEVAIEKR